MEANCSGSNPKTSKAMKLGVVTCRRNNTVYLKSEAKTHRITFSNPNTSKMFTRGMLVWIQ